MMTDTFFDWEGQRWQAARKDINPFFVHPDVISITLHYMNSHMDKKWGKVHECDFLEECHDIVKFSIV
jgi:hypothetical protein